MTDKFLPDEFDSKIRTHLNTWTHQVEGEFSELHVLNAEKALKVKLPSSYKYFLQKYGSLGFGPTEIYGFTKKNNNDFFKNTVPNMVWYNLSARKTDHPHQFIAFKSDEHILSCLDTSQFHNDECRVIYWDSVSQEIDFELQIGFADYLIHTLEENVEEYAKEGWIKENRASGKSHTLKKHRWKFW